MIIDELHIYTNHLSSQVKFYQKKLGLKVLAQSQNTVQFKIGYTSFVLIEDKMAKPYHFAINIPSNKEVEALEWLKQRVSVLKFQGNELIDFVNWNAKSIYFYDEDKNIVEFISRKNLKIIRTEPFGPDQFLGISEIGISVHDVSAIYHQINSLFPTPLYFGNLDWFCAAGDENGLFIIIDQNKKGWMPNNDFAHTSDFKIGGDHNFEFQNGKIIPCT